MMIKEELKCKSCSKIFRDPFLLPCGHSFCIKCINKLEIIKFKESRYYKCPDNCTFKEHPNHRYFGVIKNRVVAKIADKINKVYSIYLMYITVSEYGIILYYRCIPVSIRKLFLKFNIIDSLTNNFSRFPRLIF